MSKTQAVNSSTESSSGSTSDSSSTGSSSTSSGSGSSSSDSESSSSQGSSKQQNAAMPSTTTDTPMKRMTPRRSTDSTLTKQNSSSSKQDSDKSMSSTKGKVEKQLTKPVSSNKAQVKPSSTSTSDDDVPQKNSDAKSGIPKRRPSLPSKPKTTVTSGTKPPRLSTRTAQKPPVKQPPPKSSSEPTKKSDPPKKPLKKKSIFSPDNSSESEGDTNDSKAQLKNKANGAAPRPKGRPRKSSTEKTKPAASPEKPKPKPSERPTRRNSSKTNVTTPTKVEKEKPKFPAKVIVSSATSTDSDSASASTYESDSESVDEKASSKAKSPPEIKTGKTKPKPEPPKIEKKQTEITKPKENAIPPPSGPTDSDAENKKPQATRKLTRLTSARKSRHVLGRQTSILTKVLDASETESEGDSANDARRSTSRSPVKRGCISTKGPPALRKPAICTTNVNLAKSEEIPPLHERNCPLPGCDSLGHLSGRAERHFTLEACPMYHNTTADTCKASWGGGSSTGEGALRRRAITTMAARRTHQPSIEQRAYQLKVKDLRSKWKPPDPKDKPLDSLPAPDGSTTVDKNEREPTLTGFVPDYDVSLFKEAQANAAFKIEEELKTLPSCRGTRYMVMGKHRMEVWYQSPYPAEVARAPELFVCEFCLAHHAGSVATNRHKAKCIWRHPPGDEVYRKGRLGVWQVDGRRHKQYCQRLCLLAKFFLDHKTLYYDVEPFLFYVMTLADAEGCHTVGYFSKMAVERMERDRGMTSRPRGSRSSSKKTKVF